MTSFQIKISPAQLLDLNQRFPASRGSADIGKRAVEIVKIHFREVDPACSFTAPQPGADLAVTSGEGGTQQYEVKGTASRKIVWQQLKVSSQASYDLLSACGASILRVTDVYGNEPVVYELRCGEDFRLEPEARWCVKPMPHEHEVEPNF
jgi:hypothetical protein